MDAADTNSMSTSCVGVLGEQGFSENLQANLLVRYHEEGYTNSNRRNEECIAKSPNRGRYGRRPAVVLHLPFSRGSHESALSTTRRRAKFNLA